MAERYIRPEQVSASNAARILAFLNAAESAREIADRVEIPGELDIGVRLAQRILNRRNELGGFTTLQQVADVPLIGPERFTEIVVTLTGMRPPSDPTEAELDALRDQVAALSATVSGLGGAGAIRLTIRRVNPRPYLGQTVTLSIEAKGPSGEPIVGLPVTLMATWGEFHTPLGLSIDRERARVVRTGLDGSARVRLYPSSVEPLLGEHHAALEGVLQSLDAEAGSPNDVLAGLREIVRRYESPPAIRLREAVDLLVDGLGGPGVDPVIKRDIFEEWPTVDATVLALAREGAVGEGEALGSSVSAVAALTLRFRNWLPAWLSVFETASREGNDLDERLGGLAADAEAAPSYLVPAALGRVRGWVEARRGRVASHFARSAAEESIQRFLDETVTSLPLDSRISLRQGLGAVQGSITRQGSIGIRALEAGQNTVRTSFAPLDSRLTQVEGAAAGVGDLTARVDGLEGDVTTVQASVSNLSGQLGNLAQHPALTALQGQLEQLSGSLGGIMNQLDGLDARIGQIDSTLIDMDRRIGLTTDQVAGMDVRFGDLDARVDQVDGRVTQMDARVGQIDDRVGQIDDRVGVIDNRVGQIDNRVGVIDNRVGQIDNRVGLIDNRVGEIDNRVGVIGNELIGIDDRVGGVTGGLTSLTDRVEVMGSQVGDVAARVETVDRRVSGVSNVVNRVDARIREIGGSDGPLGR